jgi:hypothetical protein
MKSNLFITKILSLVIIFAVYTVFVLISLTKDPLVFKDEVSFNNTAHYLLDKDKFSEPSKPFSGQLSAPEKLLLVTHLPAYQWLIAVTTHLFGFNIYSIRLTSFFIGLLLLLLFYVIFKKIMNNNTLTLSILFLLAVDQAFISSSRIGRPEILLVFFMSLSFLFYIKTFKDDYSRNYILAGLFSGFSLMTHISSGLIPLAATNLHFLLTGRFKKLGFKRLSFLIIPALIFLILWLIFRVLPLFLDNSGLFKDTLLFLLHRPLSNGRDLYSVLKSFKGGRIAYEQVRFYVYIILFLPVSFFLRNKNGIKSFLLLTYVFIYLYLLLIGTRWYAVLFTPIASLAFAFLIREKDKYQKLYIVLLVLVISASIATQLRIIRKSGHNSYENYAKHLSCYLPLSAKVLIVDVYPDPYFYFASDRKDLRLEYSHASFNGMIGVGDRVAEAIRTADYIIIGQTIQDIMGNKYYEKYGFLIPFLLRNSESHVTLEDQELVIFNMKKNRRSEIE